MRELVSYIRGYIKEIILAPSLKLLEACFELLVPLMVAKLLDDLLIQKGNPPLVFYLTILVTFSILGMLVAIIAQYYAAKVAIGMSGRLTRDLFTKILHLPQKERDCLGVSSLVNRLTSDSLSIQIGINQFLRLFLRAPIIVFGSFIMAFWISPSLSFYYLLMILSLFTVVYGLTKWLNPLYQKVRHISDRLVAIVSEQVRGMSVIRAFGRSQNELEGFKRVNQDLIHQQLKVVYWANLLSPLTFLVVNLTLLILLTRGYVQFHIGYLSQGMLVALVNYLLQILVELLKVTMLWQSLGQAYISSRRVMSVLALPSEDRQLTGEAESNDDYLLRVSDLTFSYSSGLAPALENLNFDLRKGENLGIIGGTGAGKTTLIHLLTATYPVEQGTLKFFIKGSLATNLDDWRRAIAYVPQKTALFKGTIRSNLTLGLSQTLSDDKLWRALEIAQAATFVKERKEQLDSPVAAFGKSLSGGQQQRLMIARAILQNRPVLILDDATSALDYVTEQKLLRALKSDLPSVSLIMVSQRIRTLESLDKLLVLEAGRQEGFASPSDLLRDNTVYQSIYDSQKKLAKEATYVT